MPAGKTAKIGVWEDGVFVGAIVFGIGSGSATNGSVYGLRRHSDMAELCRVALTAHKTPVTRIVSVAIRMLQRQSPGLSLLVSFADPAHGHHGGIYCGGNWIYTGLEIRQQREFQVNGKWHHSRTASTLVSTVKGLPFRELPRKHRYLMPLTEEMREKISPLAKPYPKRIRERSADSGTAAYQTAGDGASPIRSLQLADHAAPD